MSAFDPIDVDALLAPLPSGVDGAGTDLREDYSTTSHYQRLRDARAAARADERVREAEDGADGAESRAWHDVVLVGADALATLSKDIEVAVWITEALVRLQGLPGLKDGGRLLLGLCETYWDAGFPQPDEDGMEVRSLPIGGLSGTKGDGTVMQSLRQIPLCRRADSTPLSLYVWEQAEQLATLDSERRAARVQAGAVDCDQLVNEARLDRDGLRASAVRLAEAKTVWKAFDTLLDQRLGADAPSLRYLLQALDRSAEIVVRLAGGALSDDPADGASEGEAGTAPLAVGSAGGGAAPPARTGIMTRDSALQDLDRIAEFFRRTEPHSPLAYTLDEAVRRGRMSLPDLLLEVLPDEEARNGLLQRLGIRPPPSSSGY